MGAGSSPADCILKDLEDFLKVFFLCNRKLRSYYIKNAPLRMRTAAYNVGVASDRRRRENVPRHILCSVRSKILKLGNLGDKSVYLFIGGCPARAEADHGSVTFAVLLLKNEMF